MRKNLACLNVLFLITISGLLIQVSGQWERHVIDNRIRLGVSVDTADLNGDSKPDLIANSVLDSKLYWYENDFPNWHRHTIDPDADGITFAYCGDFDSNGTMDVAACFGLKKDLYWYEQKDSIWEKHLIDDSCEGDYLLIYDLNNDGSPDIITAPFREDFVWYENRWPEWEKHVLDPGKHYFGIVDTADVNNDGIMDIVTNDVDKNLILCYSSEDNWINWTKDTLLENVHHAWMIRGGEMNGDNKTDLIVGSGSPYYPGDELCWYESDYPAWTKHVIEADGIGRSGDPKDVNKDGRMDILSWAADQNNVVWYEMEDTSWIKHHIVNVNTPRLNIFADIDGDSYDDLVTSSMYELVLARNPGNSAYVQSFNLDRFMIVSEEDSLHISAGLHNPENHDVQVVAVIKGSYSHFSDTLYLSGDSNIILRHSLMMTGLPEDKYSVELFSFDKVTDDTIRNLVSQEFHTNFSPVYIEEFAIDGLDTIVNPGDKLRLFVRIRNESPSVQIPSVEAELSCLDPNITIPVANSRFGHIGPEESAVSKNVYKINVSENCSDDTLIPIRLNIYTNDFHCWTDTLILKVHKTPSVNIKGNSNDILKIYPNPAKDVLQIDRDRHDPAKIEIYTIDGKLQAGMITSESNLSIDLGSMDTGFYILRHIAGNEVHTRRFLINK